jgi:hypothetical protein
MVCNCEYCTFPQNYPPRTFRRPCRNGSAIRGGNVVLAEFLVKRVGAAPTSADTAPAWSWVSAGSVSESSKAKKRVAFLCRDHIERLLTAIEKPIAKRGWLKAIRPLLQFVSLAP